MPDLKLCEKTGYGEELQTFELIRYPEDGRILLRSAGGGFLERNRRHPHRLGLDGHSVDEWSMFSLAFL
jgi:hypothetical protein